MSAVIRSDVTERLSIWAADELSPWLGKEFDHSNYLAELKRINSKSSHIFLFYVKKGNVSILEKPTKIKTDRYDVRIGYYNELLQNVCARPSLSGGSGIIPICLSDESYEGTTAPVFSFQKPHGSKNILLPDIDFMGWKFYERDDWIDRTSYLEKRNSAAFVGATTGGVITHKIIDELSLPRLRSAEFFKASQKVDFQLTMIVQCESDEVAERLRSMGYGKGMLSWPEQFKNRFLISIDGNGATCSRVILSLKSNSVLMKYDSPSLLYYFKDLNPWEHYIPIKSDADVERYIVYEDRNPGFFEKISRRGQEFASNFLTRESVMAYVEVLLEQYFTHVPKCAEVGDSDLVDVEV